MSPNIEDDPARQGEIEPLPRQLAELVEDEAEAPVGTGEERTRILLLVYESARKSAR